MELLVLLLLVACIIFLRSVSLASSPVTDYELERRATTGDLDASDELDYRQALPDIKALREVVLVLVEVILVTVSVVSYGWVSGAVIAAVLLLLAPFGRRIAIVCQLADRLVLRYRSRLLSITASVHPVLRWVREREEILFADAHVYSRAELQALIDRSRSVLSHDEVSHALAGLDFADKTVGSVMTPRSVAEVVEVGDVIGPVLLDRLHKTGHSRFPVVDGDIDHIVGVLYIHDLIEKKTDKKTVEHAMQKKVFYVHEQQTLEHALHAFLKTRHHLFVVVNDYRETVGLLSLEDALEALLGKKIVDEFDQFDDLRAVASHNPRKNNLSTGKTDI